MAIPRRIVVIASSILFILIIAISLVAAIEVRAPPKKLVQISIAQAAKGEQFDNLENHRAGGNINGSAFDRVDILSGTSTVGDGEPATYYISVTPTPTMMSEEGMIGETPTNPPAQSSIDEGFIGEKESSSIPKPTPQPPAAPQFPILALSYAGDGGPWHCRGDLLQKISFPPPATRWTNGTCIDLPSDARCGVFFAGKDDNCEAQLFNMPTCYNSTGTYVNTVVFMPEERPIGAIWRSMYIRCGVDAPEPALIDPSVLGGLLKKPGGG